MKFQLWLNIKAHNSPNSSYRAVHVWSHPIPHAFLMILFPTLAHLCWKKFSRALQMVYFSWMVSRCSSCCPKVRPWTRILGGRISATHCRELRTGERAPSVGTLAPARSCSDRLKEGGPSSTTSVGMAPLPWSMDTTFSWDEVLQADTWYTWRHLLYPLTAWANYFILLERNLFK